jgi:hypothetical protein
MLDKYFLCQFCEPIILLICYTSLTSTLIHKVTCQHVCFATISAYANNKYFVRFEVLTALTMKCTIFWDVTLYNLIEVY